MGQVEMVINCSQIDVDHSQQFFYQDNTKYLFSLKYIIFTSP